MASIGTHPLGLPLGGGSVKTRADDLPWKLEAPTDEALRRLQELLTPLTVETPRPTLQFAERSPGAVIERLSTLYADKGNLRTYFKENLRAELGNAQVDGISACLNQGAEFLSVAAASDLLTLPLTTYYSFLFFAAATVLAAPIYEDRLQDLGRGHGMRLSANFEVPLKELTVQLTGKRNLIQRLFGIWRERSGLPINIGGKHAWVRVPSVGSLDLGSFAISLQDLLARILGIEDIYRHTFRKPSASVKAQIWCPTPYSNPPRIGIVVDGYGLKEVEELYRLVPITRQWKLATKWCKPDRLNFVNLPHSCAGDPTDSEDRRGELLMPQEMMIPLSRGPLGEWRLVSSFEGAFVPQPALLYMVSFLLSSVARYRPDIWSEIVTPTTGEAPGLRAVIEEFYSLALQRFPLEALASILGVDLAVYHHGVEMITS